MTTAQSALAQLDLEAADIDRRRRAIMAAAEATEAQIAELATTDAQRAATEAHAARRAELAPQYKALIEAMKTQAGAINADTTEHTDQLQNAFSLLANQQAWQANILRRIDALAATTATKAAPFAELFDNADLLAIDLANEINSTLIHSMTPMIKHPEAPQIRRLLRWQNEVGLVANAVALATKRGIR